MNHFQEIIQGRVIEVPPILRPMFFKNTGEEVGVHLDVIDK